MRNIFVDICNKNNILDILVDGLEGRLPYMTKKEREDYNNYLDEIEQNYEDFININKQFVSLEYQDKIKSIVDEYEENCTCRNALLNDLYYKDGIRDGICLLLECFRSE